MYAVGNPVGKNSIISKYSDVVDSWLELKGTVDIERREIMIAQLNDSFVQETGDSLPTTLLCKLSDWILLEVLHDKDVDKVTNNEFAILSRRQLKRRDRRENSSEDNVIDYLNQKFKKRRDSLSRKSTVEIDK